jgi:glycosyltransferase involved in cell wall biosynthesis
LVDETIKQLHTTPELSVRRALGVALNRLGEELSGEFLQELIGVTYYVDAYIRYECRYQIMEELLKRDKKNRCVFVGSGDTKPLIIDTIKEKKIDDRFLFLENRSDVNNILMACDVFVFPSKFEGLGIVAIESQASGLPTVCSEFIPQETNLTDVISYHSLDKQQEWIDKINEIKNMKVDRSKYAKVVADAGYDAKESARLLEDKYLGLK